MLTFFAFMTGLLLGGIAGVAFSSFVMLANRSCREYFEKEAFDNYLDE